MQTEFKDYATIVSIMPKEFITDQKPGVTPSAIRIKAAAPGDFEVYHIPEGSCPIYRIEGEQIPQSIPAFRLAVSIAEDYWRNMPDATDDAHPGLMVLPGKLSHDEVKKNFPEALDELRLIQRRWFESLVRKADDIWGRYRAHKVIGEDHKLAAKILNVKKEWSLEKSPGDEFRECPACFTTINVRAIVCSACGAVLNSEKAKTLQFRGVERIEDAKLATDSK